ncbi:hypothetical protein BGX20_007218, partial [Mortierella sp. AD010]
LMNALSTTFLLSPRKTITQQSFPRTMTSLSGVTFTTPRLWTTRLPLLWSMQRFPSQVLSRKSTTSWLQFKDTWQMRLDSLTLEHTSYSTWIKMRLKQGSTLSPYLTQCASYRPMMQLGSVSSGRAFTSISSKSSTATPRRNPCSPWRMSLLPKQRLSWYARPTRSLPRTSPRNPTTSRIRTSQAQVTRPWTSKQARPRPRTRQVINQTMEGRVPSLTTASLATSLGVSLVAEPATRRQTRETTTRSRI